MLLPIYITLEKGLNEPVSKLKLVLGHYLVCDVLEPSVLELVPVLEFDIIEQLKLLVLFIYGTGAKTGIEIFELFW
jgi:hypothetical protein